ncbi:MAG TPA: ABC transporter permease subunit [Methylomirabilota bacterium]|jgi:His/Glu/Gln/Arg/opine family amino acid ABC transporter permease subunit|nr:ABC transporter permease subunit [Methylomirabilota bacterium]
MPPGSVELLARGAAVSLVLAAAAIIGGTLLAIVLTTLAFSRYAVVRAVYRVYVYVVRGTPLLVLALLLFYALPALDLRTGPYIAGTLVLIIYTGALFAEVFRGGVLAIPRPQRESARSLGLPPLAMFRKIIAPLVTRYTLPPYVNVCVMTVKASSVLSIISVWELTLAAREIIERTFAVFSVLTLAAAFYFVMCFGIDRLGRRLERHLALKGFAGERA